MKKMYRGKVEVENRSYHRLHFNLGIRFAVMQKGELPKPIKSLSADMGAGGMAMHTTIR